MKAASASPDYSLWELTLYMTKLGAIGFGGPVALVGYMHRELVDDRRWILRKLKKLPEPVIVALSAVARLLICPMLKT
jgi:chromate transporter